MAYMARNKAGTEESHDSSYHSWIQPEYIIPSFIVYYFLENLGKTDNYQFDTSLALSN